MTQRIRSRLVDRHFAPQNPLGEIPHQRGLRDVPDSDCCRANGCRLPWGRLRRKQSAKETGDVYLGGVRGHHADNRFGLFPEPDRTVEWIFVEKPAEYALDRSMRRFAAIDPVAGLPADDRRGHSVSAVGDRAIRSQAKVMPVAGSARTGGAISGWTGVAANVRSAFPVLI